MPRTIVVTGGSSGIGSEIASRFEERGDTVVIIDRNQPSNGRDFVECDLSKPASIQAACEKLPEQIDVLVNAAGVSGLAPIETVMRVNFYGLRSLTELIAPRMSSGGCVVNVASTSAWFWRNHLDEIATVVNATSDSQIAAVCENNISDGHSAYERSKQSVLVWTTIAAQQYLGRFRVNSVSPGPIETPLLADFYEAMGHEELDPLTARAGGRNGEPGEIADVVLFLASPQSNWINGTDIPVDNSAEMSEFLASRDLIPPMEKK